MTWQRNDPASLSLTNVAEKVYYVPSQHGHEKL